MTFADFLNDNSFNLQQSTFMKKVIDYVEDNGYLEMQTLMKGEMPFDRPRSVVDLFDMDQLVQLKICIDQIRNNAMMPVARRTAAVSRGTCCPACS